MKTKQAVKQQVNTSVSSFVKKIIPLEFQITAKENAKFILLSSASALIQSPTGSGKTVIACSLIEEWIIEQSKILVLVNTQQLLIQFYSTLKDFGITASVFHNDITRAKPTKENPKGELLLYRRYNPVQITMPITFMNKDRIKGKSEFDNDWKPDYIVIDEAHKGTTEYYQEIRALYPNAKLLGLTATPYRAKNKEGEHLTKWYEDRLITTITIEELIALKRLVRPRYVYFPAGKGESEHMIKTWLREANNKPTIVFTLTTLESRMIQQAFLNIGVAAEYVTSGSVDENGKPIKADTPLQRQEKFDNFESGKTKVLISCGVLCEGFDCPPAEVCILFRNITTHSLYHQIIGRVLRAHPNKTEALIIDFRNNFLEHGHVEDFVWDINDERPVISNVKQGQKIEKDEFNRKSRIYYYTCPICNHMYNLKKTDTCDANGCGTKAIFEVGTYTTKYKEVQKVDPNIKDPKALKIFTDKVLEIINIKNDAIRWTKMKFFNEFYEKAVFDLHSENIMTTAFKHLPKLLKERIDANAQIPVEV